MRPWRGRTHANFTARAPQHGRPCAGRSMNNKQIEQMASLRRDGFTMRAIGKEVGVSERSVRRYVTDVEPEIRLPSLNLEELADLFYDHILAQRRLLTRVASEQWEESFDLGFEAVDAAMQSLREQLSGMDKVTIKRLGADEELRAEFFGEFMVRVGRQWIDELNGIRFVRRLKRQLGDAVEWSDDADADGGPSV